jgi:hypothetical protein
VYTLEVDEEGVGLLRVSSGWVAFEIEGRESFVPAGAMCVTRPGLGPGTPFFEDAPAALQAAIAAFDAGDEGQIARPEALAGVLEHARRRDAFTLWHLLTRVRPEETAAVFARLAALVPAPNGVTVEGILARDRRQLDAWWDALGLDDASWWRLWKGPVPAR